MDEGIRKVAFDEFHALQLDRVAVMCGIGEFGLDPRQ